MFSGVYDNELALVRGVFVHVERDPWTESVTECLMRPGAIHMAWVEPRFVVPDDDAFEDELCTILSSATRLTQQHAIYRTALLLTQCANQVWVVLYAHVSRECSTVYPVPQLQVASVSTHDDTTSAVYRLNAMPSPRLNVAELVQRVARACLAATPMSIMTEVYIQTTCGLIQDVMIGTTLYQVGSLFPPSDVIASGQYCVLKPHHGSFHGMNDLVPVLTASGVLLGLRRIVKSAVFTSLCIYVTDAALLDAHTLVPEAQAELNRLVDSISASAKSLSVQRVSTASDRVLHHAHGPQSLYNELVAELMALTSVRDVATHVQNVMESETINPLVKAAVAQRATAVVQRRTTQAKLAAVLSVPHDALRELEGLCFDVLIDRAHESSLPLEWQQDKFYTAGDAGFVSMLYLLQWASTVSRFMALARTASSCLPTQYRTGILWDGESGQCQSVHHVDTDGTHLFLFNPARAAMTLCPEMVLDGVEWRVDGSLQTQSARARDTVVSFFIAHAVHLLAPLISPHDPMQAALMLHGMYAGAVQVDDLRHNYKHWQRVVRELRQQVPVKKRRSP